MPAMDDAAERAARSARELARRTGSDRHDVLLVLGSGLTGAAEILGAGGDSLPLDTLPFFPRYTAAGHRAQGWSVDVARKRVLVFGGRCHLYEGIDPDEVVHPLRTGIAAGCTTVVLTAAVGGIRDDLTTGSVMVVEDHLNLTGRSPLSGATFVDMADAYSPELLELALTHPGPGGRRGVAPARRLRAGVGTAVRDAGRDPDAAHAPAPTSWGCPWRSRPSPPGTPAPRCWASPWSPTLRRARLPAGPATSRRLPTSATRPHRPWPTSSATS